MFIRTIEPNSLYLERIREINREAFPVEERMSVEEMYNWQGKSEVAMKRNHVSNRPIMLLPYLLCFF